VFVCVTCFSSCREAKVREEGEVGEEEVGGKGHCSRTRTIVFDVFHREAKAREEGGEEEVGGKGHYSRIRTIVFDVFYREAKAREEEEEEVVGEEGSSLLVLATLRQRGRRWMG